MVALKLKEPVWLEDATGVERKSLTTVKLRLPQKEEGERLSSAARLADCACELIQPATVVPKIAKESTME
jgi:hypothetical protein